MTLLILFIAGYFIGSLSVLLLVGLALVNRRDRQSYATVELLSYDAERSLQ